jgi:hypothetical protein
VKKDIEYSKRPSLILVYVALIASISPCIFYYLAQKSSCRKKNKAQNPAKKIAGFLRRQPSQVLQPCEG